MRLQVFEVILLIEDDDQTDLKVSTEILEFCLKKLQVHSKSDTGSPWPTGFAVKALSGV